MERRSVELGAIQETQLIPLYARAAETPKKRPLISDPKAVEILAAIDYDFTRFDNAGRSMRVPVLRGKIFDPGSPTFSAITRAGRWSSSAPD